MFEEFIEPTKLLIGKGISNIPIDNKDEVLKKYGKKVLNNILELKQIFYSSDAYKSFTYTPNWEVIHQKVVNDFKEKYPLASEELIELFWWTYSFSLWKNGIV